MSARRCPRPIARLAAVLALVTACAAGPLDPGPREGATRRIGDVLWYDDYGVALEIARRRGAPLWVHFGEDPG